MNMSGESDQNLLIQRIEQFISRKGLNTTRMALRWGIPEAYLVALIEGGRDIDSMSIDSYRKLAAVIGVSPMTAMILAGAITMNDFIDSEY